MATNNTISPDNEGRTTVQMPVYGNTTPIGTYYGEQGNEQADVMQRMINEWAARTDPKAQAEQDEKTRRGRNFWTGANLFANVIANAINANGTAKGAPNMTWNDNAQQKMFETWQTADRELKADRRAAQQRLDALRLQDAQMRGAGAEKRAAENKAVADMNFNIGLEDARFRRNQEAQDAVRQDERDYQDRVRQDTQQFQAGEAQRQRNFTAAQNRENREHQEAMVDRRAQTSKGYNKGTKTIRIGNTDFKAETEAEADANISQVYGMVLAAYNRQFSNPLQQQAFDGKVDNEYSFINAHINQLYASDPEFKAQYDAFVRDHARSVSQNHGSQQGGGTGGGGQQSNPNDIFE